MPDAKEPHFFAQNLSARYCRIKTETEYLNLFKPATDEQICGEASVLYGYYPNCLKDILQWNPQAKFIVMIRDPVAFLPSYHRQLYNNMDEDILDCEQAYYAWEQRKKGYNVPKTNHDIDLLDYKQACSIGDYLTNITNIIPTQQLYIGLLDDMQGDPHSFYKEILKFLDVSIDHVPSFDKKNSAYVMQSRHLQKMQQSNNLVLKLIKAMIKRTGMPIGAWIQRLNKKEQKTPPLSAEFKQKLYRDLQPQYNLIQQITKRDLSQTS